MMELGRWMMDVQDVNRARGHGKENLARVCLTQGGETSGR